MCLPRKIQLPVRHLLANPQAAIGLQLSAHLVRRLALPVIRQLRRAEGELQIGRLFEGISFRRRQLIISPNEKEIGIPLHRDRLERNHRLSALDLRPHAIDDKLVVTHIAQLRLNRRVEIGVERFLGRIRRRQFFCRGNFCAQTFHRRLVVADQVPLRRQLEARDRVVGLDRAIGLQAAGDRRWQKSRDLLQIRRVDLELQIARRAPKTGRRLGQLHRALQPHVIRPPIDLRLADRRCAIVRHHVESHAIERDPVLPHVVDLGRDRSLPAPRLIQRALPVHLEILHVARQRARRSPEILAQLA